MNKNRILKTLLICSLLIIVSCGQDSGTAPSLSGAATDNSTDTGSGNGSSTCNPCKIFGTNNTFSGDLLAAGSIDSACMSDANKPSDGATYKAFYLDLGYREPGTNWMFHANTSYVRPDGTAIGSTDSDGKLTIPLSAGITGVNEYFWTGITTSWTSNSNCTDYTDGTSGAMGAVGRGDSTAYLSLGGTIRSCDNLFKLYCVQQ